MYFKEFTTTFIIAIICPQAVWGHGENLNFDKFDSEKLYLN